MLEAGWADSDTPDEALYDLWLDPAEGTNRIADPRLADIADELRRRLHDWMVRTDDPLLDGSVPPGPGTVFNTADQRSAEEPTVSASDTAAEQQPAETRSFDRQSARPN